MALIPKISLSINNTCLSMKVVEQTGLYVTNENPGGWDGPNINTNDIDTASILVTDVNNSQNTATIALKNGSVNVFNSVPSEPAPAEFIAYAEYPWELQDGIFKVEYTVTSESTNYINKTQYELFLCNLCNCKDNLVVELVNNPNSPEVTRLKETLDNLEILEYGIQTAFACKNFTRAKELLDLSAKLCSVATDCGCGCN